MPEYSFVIGTYRVEKQVAKTAERALSVVYHRLRPGERIVMKKSNEIALLEKVKEEEGGEEVSYGLFFSSSG